MEYYRHEIRAGAIVLGAGLIMVTMLFFSADLAFWFNNTDEMDTITGGGERPRRLAEKMSQALVHFARNGDPNHSGIPAWPTYDSENGALMIWNDDCVVQHDPDREARNTLHALLGE